ncbi:MAG: DUF285 domain-containing protein [Clostridia bacterium]|nr:DUF285 domain-containing protein [Clostridia bacterium]
MDLTNLDTSNVVDMSDMFSECANLTSLNIADWDTSKVENMAYMSVSML